MTQEIARIIWTDETEDIKETKVFIMIANSGKLDTVEIDTDPRYPLCHALGHYTIVHRDWADGISPKFHRDMLKDVHEHLRDHLLPGMFVSEYGDIIYAPDTPNA